MKKLSLILMALVAVFALSCKNDKKEDAKCECGDKCEEKCGKECKCEKACDEECDKKECDKDKKCEKECDKECDKDDAEVIEATDNPLIGQYLDMQKEVANALKEAKSADECNTVYNKYLDDMMNFYDENENEIKANKNAYATPETTKVAQELSTVMEEKMKEFDWMPDMEKSMAFAEKVMKMMQ